MDIQNNAMEKASNKIKIINGDDIKFIIVKNGKLKKAVLKDYFGKNGTLIYKINGDDFLLETDTENIYLESGVEVYFFNESKVQASEEISGRKRKRFEEILDDLYDNKDVKEHKSKLTKEAIGNKKKISNESSHILKQYTKRNLTIGWRHRNSFQSDYKSMGQVIGPMMRIELNGNQDYSVEELKDIMVKEYVNDQNRYFFDKSVVCIGTYDGISILEFINYEGDQCSFWEFIKEKNLRKKSHVLKMYLLTTFFSGVEIKQNTATNSISKTEDSSKSSLCKNVLKNITNGGSEVVNVVSRTNNNFLLEPKILNLDTDDNLDNSAFYLKTDYVEAKSKKNFLENVNESKDSTLSIETNDKFLLRPNILNSHTDDNLIPSPLYSKLTGLDSDDDKSGNTSKNSEFSFKKPLNVVKKCKIDNFEGSIPVVNENDIIFSSEIIGEGGQGVVSKGKFLGTNVAIKSLQKGKYNKDILKEVKLLEKLRHPHIIGIMAVCSTITQFHIVMEFFNSFSLQNVIFDPKIKASLSLNDLKKNKIAYELCCAVAYLHLQRVPIIHRDLKPANVLVNKHFYTKLCDLGLGKCNDLDASLQSTMKGRVCGTLLYMAPEIFVDRKEATVNSDIWSLACTLVELYSENDISK